MFHIEMYDGTAFCDESVYDNDDEYVRQSDWHDRDYPAAINEATCEACLRKMLMLGLTADDRLSDLLGVASIRDLLDSADDHDTRDD